MPRSPSDATRFTSTTPHAAKPFYPASSNPGRLGRSSRSPPSAPGPAGETPQEKVRRLRAAADRAREAKVTGFDRVIATGRVWADRAHKVTALGLIGLTCVAGVVTVYALGDMVVYNRRKKKEYFAEQRALADLALQNAEVALRSGRATEEQISLLEERRGKGAIAAEINARAKEALADGRSEAAEIKEKGVLASATGWLFSGLKKEDTGPGGVLDIETSEDERVGEQSGVMRAVEARREELAEKERREGGEPDRLGTEEEKKSGGWMSFMVRK